MSIVKLNYIDQYNEYFENIARRHQDLAHSAQSKHFYAFNVDEIDTGFRGEINFPALVLEYPEGSLSGPNQDQLNEIVTGAYWVVCGPARPNDVKDIREKLLQSKQIGYDILSAMIRDALDNIIVGFDPRNVVMMKIGPLMDDYYFYRFEFTASVPVKKDLCFDTTKWL